MNSKMDLKYMINLCEQELGRDEIVEIEDTLRQYFEECTEENIAAIVGPVYHEVRKSYRCKKDTAQSYDDFWNEVTRFYYYASCINYEMRCGVNDAMQKLPFLSSVMKGYAEKLIESTYGNTFQARLIAQHEDMGGMNAVIEAMTKKLEKRSIDSWVSQLINKHFGRYKHNYYAVHYIAASCLERYRPDIQESRYQEYFSCYYDIDELSPSNAGLYAILTLHLKKREGGL